MPSYKAYGDNNDHSNDADNARIRLFEEANLKSFLYFILFDFRFDIELFFVFLHRLLCVKGKWETINDNSPVDIWNTRLFGTNKTSKMILTIINFILLLTTYRLIQ